MNMLQHAIAPVITIVVAELLKQRIKQEADFESPAEEAFLNLLVAADAVRARLDRLCAEHGVTHGQYNVLRILRGVHPGGHPRCEIAARLIERAPDVTRLVDRLEAAGLVERSRSEEDRRVSLTRITRKGLELLEAMEPALDAFRRDFGERVSRQDARELTRICEGIYSEE
jgi:DNA-binding MarR family transcriptional regulator